MLELVGGSTASSPTAQLQLPLNAGDYAPCQLKLEVEAAPFRRRCFPQPLGRGNVDISRQTQVPAPRDSIQEVSTIGEFCANSIPPSEGRRVRRVCFLWTHFDGESTGCPPISQRKKIVYCNIPVLAQSGNNGILSSKCHTNPVLWNLSACPHTLSHTCADELVLPGPHKVARLETPE